MGRLKGKVAIITGAASGIGAATAELFAREGAQVIATDVQVEKLTARLPGIEAFKHDVSSEGQWQDLVGSVLARYGRIDVLVNNAGIAGKLVKIEDDTQEHWRKILDTNLNGCFLGMKAVIPAMKRAAKGSIINVSSIAGVTGMAGGTAYTASKGGLRLLSKGVAVNHAADGIRVNCVEPGYILTPMLEEAIDAREIRETVPSLIPMARIGRPEEIAQGILFLASDESSYMTGADLVIDGGFTAG